MNLKAITLIFAALTLQYFATQACITFTFKTPDGQIIYGRNFDFPSGLGHVHLNYRGVEKFSFVAPPEKSISWVSKYGSVRTICNVPGKKNAYLKEIDCNNSSDLE